MTTPTGTIVARDVENPHIRYAHIDAGEHGTLYPDHPAPGDHHPCQARWCRWLNAHGLNPEEMSASCPVVCDDRARTITYLKRPPLYRNVVVPELGPDEMWIGDPVPPPGSRMVRRQLESPAAPFPGGDPA